MDILLRFGFALVIVGLSIGLYWALVQVRLLALRRSSRAIAGLEGFRLGVPAILYFTTPDCAPCRTQQSPALEELHTQLGERLQIIKVDASARIDLADQWGVLSVPTTFIIDARGEPRHINNGVASATKLYQQLRQLAAFK